MAKSVAVSVGIVLMGAVFSGCGFLESMFGGDSTSAQSSSSASSTAKKKDSNIFSSLFGTNDDANRAKCSGNEIKTDTGIEKGECKDGKRSGAWKYYDKDGYIQKEITWQNGEMTLQKEYDKDENPKLATAYNKGKVVSKREYEKGKFYYFTHYYTEDNVSVERKYDIYPLKSIAETKTKQIKEKAIEVAKQRAQSKVKKPTMQEVAKSKGAMEAYREKLKAQVEKELQVELRNALHSEVIIIDANFKSFDDYSDDILIAFIKNNNPTPRYEIITTNDDMKIKANVHSFTGGDSIELDFYVNINNKMEYIGGMYNSSCSGSYDKYNCRTFAKHYKQLIDKSVFKDEIYKNLPKPKNQ